MDATPSRRWVAGDGEDGRWTLSMGRAAWVALLAPALLMLWSAYAMWVTWSPTPYADQWLDIHQRLEAGRNGWFSYFLAQHFEHRIFFPRLVFTADWEWFQGRNILNLAVIGLCQLAGAALFVRVAQVRRAGAVGLLGLAAALSLVFSLMQWETLFWGFCVQVVGVYVPAAWALYAFCMGSRDSKALRWGWMAAALALLAVATFNSANGMGAGVAMLLVAAVTRRGLSASVVAGAATAILVAVYMHGYHTPAHHEAPALLRHPGRIVTYWVTFLGNIWWPREGAGPALVGLVGVGATAGMVVVMWRDRTRDPARAALLGIALFVGMSAALASLGRLQLGLWSAMSSRYMTGTAYFWAAQAVFWALTAQRASMRAARLVLGAALVLAILRLVALQPVGYQQLRAVHKAVALASSVLLGGVADGQAVLPIDAFVDPSIVSADVAFLRSTRAGLFAEPAGAAVGSLFSRPRARAGACRGAFVTIDPAPSAGPPGPRAAAQVWHGEGWGWDVDARRSLGRVVIVDGAGRVLGVGLSGLQRPDVNDGVPRPGIRSTSGWIVSLNRGAGGEAIAYGVTAAGTACELGRKAWR